MELIKPEDLKPAEEAARFDWLLHDTPEGMLEIQGGCGFSKTLLLVFHRITFFAARIQQEPESFYTPMSYWGTLRKLRELKQWSRETSSWAEAQRKPQHIEWIRKEKGSVIQDRQ